MARILYAMMRYGIDYLKRTEAEFTEQRQKKMEQNLQRRARELGYELVKKADPPTAETELP